MRNTSTSEATEGADLREMGFMSRKVQPVLCGLVSAVAGCATVEPRVDYEQAAARIAEATGEDNVYQPGFDDVVAGKVEDLLADGITADEAVQVCLLSNPGLQAAFLNIGMARADLVQSGLLSNPTLGMSLRLPSGGGLANLEAGIAQNIADLWQLPIRKQAARQALDRTILELAQFAPDDHEADLATAIQHEDNPGF